MNKFKRTIFLSLMAVCLISIAFPYLKNFPIKNYGVSKEVTLKKGEYIIGEDINPGSYDVVVLKDNVNFMQRKLSINNKLLGIQFNNDEHIIIEGKGEVKLTPSKFKPLHVDKENTYKLLHSGFYRIGQQIPAGSYRLSYVTTQNNKHDRPLIQVLSKKREVINSYNFETKKSYDVRLNKEDILEVNKLLFEESNNITVILKKN